MQKRLSFISAILMFCLLISLSGCANEPNPSPSNVIPTPTTTVTPSSDETPTPTPTSAPTPAPTLTVSAGADVTVLELDGMSIAIPSEYYELLAFNTKSNIYHTDGALIEVLYKPIYEQEHAMGWLYSIVRYSCAQYEQYLSKGDSSGQSFFAKDDTYYYGFFRPTDIQFFYINDMDIYNDLRYNVSEFVRQDMITRNDLTPYSDDDFWSKTYTYESDHIYLTYYPYYAYQDTAAQQNFSWQDVAYTLVLSQPAAQGDTGIWCVERMYDDPKYGFIYVYFPNADGLSSAEYYAKLQDDCDSGLRPDLLDSTQVALDYVKQRFGHSAATVESFSKSDGLPEGNFRH